MSMDVGGSKGGPKSDINVTPLVDVMLVLLIIMMLVAPMLQKGVDVKLPLAANTSDKPENEQQTVLAVDAQDKFYVNSIQVSRAEMADRVKLALEEKTERVVLIKGDTDASYRAIMAAMDDLRKAGIEDIGLITDPKVDPNTPAQPVGGK
jgi:biopolymer transport protein TolR